VVVKSKKFNINLNFSANHGAVPWVLSSKQRLLVEEISQGSHQAIICIVCELSHRAAPIGPAPQAPGPVPANSGENTALAPMVKSVDTADLKSAALHRAYRFDSGSGHQAT